MKVKDITDVYQLLKASSICKEDLNQMNMLVDDDEDDGGDSGSSIPNRDIYLVLKKWREIHPGTEFRCFVRNKNLIGKWDDYSAPNGKILTKNFFFRS